MPDASAYASADATAIAAATAIANASADAIAKEPPMSAQRHDVRFQRNTRTGDHRAVCTCGWFHFGTLDDCQLRAATHDMEWQAVEPPIVEAQQ